MSARISLIFLLCICAWLGNDIQGQKEVQSIDSINLSTLESGSITYWWLHLIDDGLSRPISIPLIIAKGKYPGPTLGLTAAIHGNELNGIPIIQQIFEELDIENLKGSIIGIPGLNTVGINQDSRRFIDETDLNRIFPGKKIGNRSQQFVWQFSQKVLPSLDYLVDMHTASFGRVNSLYVRTDLRDSLLSSLATIQHADIILSSKGPNTGSRSSEGHSLREEAMGRGIPCLTIEYGNPQVYQPRMISRGKIGIKNIMISLGMTDGTIVTPEEPAVICQRSYWLYVDRGGLLDIPVELNEVLEAGQVIGILKDPFGKIIKKYSAAEAGIVIGKSTNPINMQGGRILHLGIISP